MARIHVIGIALALLAIGAGARAIEPFEWIEIASSGRSVAAELADLSGDGRADLLTFAHVGVPPEEQRLIRVHLQRSDGGLPAAPDHVVPLPAETAAYDIAPLPDEAGHQLLLLRPHGLTILSFARKDPAVRELLLPEAPSVGAVRDERGLERLPLVREEFGGAPVLLVPRFGEAVLMSPSGEVRARLEVGGHANYFVPPEPGALLAESAVEVYFDAPRLMVSDADGDGRMDVLAASRRELRLFRQRENGSFPSNADRTLIPTPASEQDHVRGTGQFRVGVTDLDGDERADLLVSRSSGGLMKAKAQASVHRNRGGWWDLDAPDQVLAETKGWGGDQLADLDGDGLPDLVHVRIPMSAIELIEFLVTRSIDVEFTIYPGQPGGLFAPEAWIERKLQVPIDFETLRPAGFLPSFSADLNRDGYADLLTSRRGDAIDVYLGGPEHRFRSRQAHQKTDTRGRLRIVDLDGDGFQDLLIYAPALEDVPIRIARNRGLLPGSSQQAIE
jgi:hypothetical protein